MGIPSQKPISLGTDVATGEDVYTTPKERAGHTHVMGSTDEGKSFGLENMIRQDIWLGNGVCLIDPHGTLYDKIVRWCVTYGFFESRNIVLLNPSDKEWAFGFNPFSTYGDGHDGSERVDSIAEAIATVCGGQDIDKMRQFKESAKLIIHTARDKDLSLYETKYLMLPIYEQVRLYLTKDIKDDLVRETWKYMNTELKPIEYDNKFGVSARRIADFIMSPVLRCIFGQKEKTLNAKAIMDEGGVLLVNLNPKGISLNESRLLGKLLVNEFVLATRQRNEGDRPLYLYIDECGRYVSNDISVTLDELRKRGLIMTLCHHFLEQIRNEAGEVVCESIKNNTKTKILFGGVTIENLKELIPDMFAGHINWEEPIESLIRPTVIGQELVALRQSGKGKAKARGGSATQTEGDDIADSSNTSKSIVRDKDGNIISINVGNGGGSGRTKKRGTSDTNTWVDTETEQEGVSETFKNVYKNLSTQNWSREDQIHKVCEQVRMQLQQHAVVQIRKDKPVFIKIPTLRIKPEFASKEEVQKVVEENYKSQEITKPAEEIKELIDSQCLEIEQNASGKHKLSEDSFKEFNNYGSKSKKNTSQKPL